MTSPQPFASAIPRRAPQRPRRRQAGFTLLELSVAMVIIAIILGAVSVGGDLMRAAHSQRIFGNFVMAWSDAFARYVAGAGVVPGDDPLDPHDVIRGAGGAAELCNAPGAPTLTNVFLARGVSLPEGGPPGAQDRYVYQDGNGSPHELQVCFMTVAWSVPGTSAGAYIVSTRHVMRLTGLTTELAMQLDTLVDGRLDARFGRLRQATAANSLSATGLDWPAVRTAAGEANIGEVTAFLEMQ